MSHSQAEVGATEQTMLKLQYMQISQTPSLFSIRVSQSTHSTAGCMMELMIEGLLVLKLLRMLVLKKVWSSSLTSYFKGG